MIRTATLLICFLLCLQGLAQNENVPDSLEQRLQEAKTDQERANIILQLSRRSLSINNFRALEYAERSIKLAKKINSDSLAALGYANQGNAFLQLGNYSRALQSYQEAVTGAEKSDNRYLLSSINGNMGSIYYYQRDHDRALTYYKKSLELYDTTLARTDPKKLVQKANLLNNIGIVYEETKKFEDAMRYYKEALKVGEQAKDPENNANVLNNIGTLYKDQGDNTTALKYYLEALDIRRKNNNRVGLVRSCHNIGYFYVDTNQPVLAEPYLKEAVAIGEEIGAWQSVSSAYDLLYKVYKSQGAHQESLAALEQSMRVNDSLFNEQSTRKIAQLEMQFEFDKKQALVEAEQKEKELYFWSGAAGLILLLIIVTLLFFLQRSKTKQSKLEQAHLELEKINLKNDLALKDKELATNIMYLLNKNELINTISEKLLDIKQNIPADSQSALQKLILDLQSNLQPELWQEFEFRFQQVHEQFYKRLNEKFPDLTPSERRLCAFLKLNMTTKEISALTYQNAKSIDVARTRLRKKLNLTGTDHNLVTFLAQLDTTSANGTTSS